MDYFGRASSTQDAIDRAELIERIKLDILENEIDKKTGRPDRLMEILESYFEDVSDLNSELTTIEGGYKIRLDEIIPEIDTTKNVYVVSFNTNGGTSISSQIVTQGDKAIAPSNPTKSGGTFMGWYSDSGLQNAFDFQTSITSNTTLYAKWGQLAHFTYKDATYYYEAGMTWRQFVSNPSYNTYGFYITTLTTGRELTVDPISGKPLEHGYGKLNVIYALANNEINEIEWVEAYFQVCCFDPGSKVLMADGSEKNIEKVTEDDYVMSLNEETGEYIAQKVKKTIVKHNSDDLVYINLSDGSRIGMRAYHPLLTTKGWKSLRPYLAETIFEGGNLEKLEVGDELVGINKNLMIISIETRPEVDNYDTYNLSMSNCHNYIVNGVVVHNVTEICDDLGH